MVVLRVWALLKKSNVLKAWKLLVFGLFFTLLASACTGERPVLTSSTIPPTTVMRAPPSLGTIDVRAQSIDETIDIATVASAKVDQVEIYEQPDFDSQQIHTMAHPIPSGGPLVFLVDQTQGEWHEVLLPVRPNGATGWVHDDQVLIGTHNYRIEVSLSDFELKIHNGGSLVFQATVAVARENAPTPGGRYFITELLQPLEPNTVYGDFAYGLSGFSETFETFAGGPGQLGIHGTNNPDAIGTQASAGCVRLANGDIAHMVTFLPLGTPVTILS